MAEFVKSNWNNVSDINFEGLDENSFKDYKSLLFLDLDGTSKAKEPLLEQFVFDYLAQLEKQKLVLTIFNSGRPVESLKDMSRDLKLSQRLVIGSNGGRAVYTKQESNGERTHYFYGAQQDPYLASAYKKLKEATPELALFGTYNTNGPDLIFSVPYDVALTYREIISKYPEFAHLRVTYCGSGTAHLHSNKTSKGIAIRKILATTKYPKEFTMAAGDSYNDLDVAPQVNFTIAVENATPDFKQLATYVSPYKASFGVVDGVNTFLLNNKLATETQLKVCQERTFQTLDKLITGLFVKSPFNNTTTPLTL